MYEGAAGVLFTETAMESGGVSITLEKPYPHPGGLGGGRATRRRAAGATDLPYAPLGDRHAAGRLAEKLGSDVP